MRLCRFPNDQFSQLMEAITSSQRCMDDKLAQFQAEVHHGEEGAAMKALKWAKYEKPYAYRKKGNKEQAVFNI